MKAKAKRKIVTVILAVVFLILASLFIWFEWELCWKLRTSAEIRSVDVMLLDPQSGYEHITVTDWEEQDRIHDMALKIQDSFNIFGAKIHDAEKYQKDPDIFITFTFNDGEQREIAVQKDSAVIFANFGFGLDKYVSMDNIDTNDMYDYFQEYFS